MFHETQRVNVQDKYFVVGGNPDGSGGGVIATTNSEFQAIDLKHEAIKHGYRDVRVTCYNDLMNFTDCRLEPGVK